MTLNAKIKNLIVLFILAFMQFGCSKNEEQVVPYVRVSMTINLQLPKFNALTSVNNAVLCDNEGYNKNGVIIYRYSLEEFTAFDATCPRHIDTKPTAVILDDNGSAGTATCPECKTVYYFFNYAYPSSGYPLRRYSLTRSGNMLYIIN